MHPGSQLQSGALEGVDAQQATTTVVLLGPGLREVALASSCGIDVVHVFARRALAMCFRGYSAQNWYFFRRSVKQTSGAAPELFPNMAIGKL